MLKSKYCLANFKNKSLYEFFLNIKNKDFFFILFVFFIHLITKKNFPINLEFAFIEAANYFDSFQNIYLENYRKDQSNTLIYSLFIYFINKFLFLDNLSLAGLIIASSSYFFLYLSVINFQNYFDIKNRFALIILLLLNPVIWIYGYRINPDLISASLGFFAISFLFTKKTSAIKIFFSLFFLIIAVLLKPFLLFLILIASYQVYSIKSIQFKKKIIIIISYYIFPASFLFSYFIWSKIYMDVVIDDRLKFLSFYNSIDYFILNLLYYFGLLFIFISPLFFCNYVHYIKENKFSTRLVAKILIGIFFFYFGYKIPYFFGEINFGNFFLINENILKGFFCLFFYISLIFFYEQYKLLSVKYRSIFIIFLISLFIFLIILSLSRPVQRYLTILVPFFYIFFHKNIKKNYIYFLLVFFFIIINFILCTFSYLRAQVAEDIYSYLVKNSFLEKTEPGPISDSYPSKMFDLNEKYYKITSEKTSDDAIIFSREIMYIRVTYYLTK